MIEHPRRTSALWIGALAIACACAALGAQASASQPASAKAGARPHFYQPPKHLPHGRHGTLIRERSYHGPGKLAGGKNTLLLYKQRGIHQRTVATSGYVAVPRGKPPKGGWPVVSWGHGTTGIADKCAPSRYDNAADRETNDPTLERWIGQGYAVVRSDYEGLGTPRPHPYLIGRSEGRSMLDAVRAARQANPKLGKRLIVAGHSQGGHAALWAAAMAPRYTPELKLKGTLAYAPQSHTAEELEAFRNSGATRTTHPTATILRGLDVASRGFDARSLLTERGAELYPQTLTLCTAQLAGPDSFGGLPTNQLIEPDADLSKATQLVHRNDPGKLKIKKPVRLEQGLSDGTVPAPFDEGLSQQLAEARTHTVSYQTYEGATHATVMVSAGHDADAFLARRFHHPAPPTAEQARALGKQAYDFGFPLLEFVRTRHEMTSVHCPDGEGNAPVNSFANAKSFPGPDDRTVVAPNTDTLYSIAHLDLRHGPIVLSHPKMDQRYYSFELLDPYTNVIDIPGAREDGGGAGKFEIAWKERRGKGKPPRGARVIHSKYRRVWIIGRTLATDQVDQRRAKRLMSHYKLRIDGEARKFRKRCKSGEPAKFPTPTDGHGFIRALNKAMRKNPPRKRDRRLLRKLKPLGIGAGLAPGRAGLTPEVKAALYAGVAEEAAALPNASKLRAYNGALKTDGWLLPPDGIGDYGTDYGLRAFIASVGLGANTPEEATYPAGIADATGALYSGANDYRLTFPPGDQPPAKYFWSLTMYDIDGYLAPNPIDRYSLGPSHPPLVRKPDGSIVVAIQRTKPTEAGVNWLPSPPAAFRLNLRLYGPSKAAQNGVWRPPGVVQVAP